MFAIGSEMVDAPQKFSNNHAHDAQSCRLGNEIPELTEHGLQIWTVGKIERFSSTLVKLLAQWSVGQPAISSAAAVLQSADEMEMAELNDPALAFAELDNSGNLVGDRCSDTFANVSGDCRDRLRPALHVLASGQQHRIEEDSSVLIAGLDRHHIQDPISSLEAEIKSVQDQHQRSPRHAQIPRSRYELAQHSTKTPTQPLTGNPIAWRQRFQCASVQQYSFQKSRTHSVSFAASSFLADSPRALALTALTTSRTETIDFRSATGRFRVPRVHARELDTNNKSKYAKTRRNSG
jgi:hypothetical protein